MRGRAGDALELARAFLKKSLLPSNRVTLSFTREAERWIANFDWPGNVRQLENVIHFCVAFSEGDMIDCDILEMAVSGTGTNVEEAVQRRAPLPLTDNVPTLDEIIARAIDDAVSRYQGSTPQAAAVLAVRLSTIYRHFKARQKSVADAPSLYG